MAFHLTARIQGREPLFRGIEPRIVEIIVDASRLAAVRLLAFAVMPNHLHLVVLQGAMPLSRLMQPLLRRAAGVVARVHRREGHVFERRYADSPCLDAGYLRNALAYVHLNPVRASLCMAPEEYPWTSHLAYAAQACHSGLVPDGTELGLRLFSTHERGTTERCAVDYLRFIAWRQAMDAFLLAEGADHPARSPQRPDCRGGDELWVENFEAAVASARAWLMEHAPRTGRADLSLVVRTALAAEEGAPSDLRWLRSGARGSLLSRVRANVIARCLTAGYTNKQVASYLNVSHSTVSRIAAERRRLYADSATWRRPGSLGRF